MNDQDPKYDIQAEIDLFFHDDSITNNEQPCAVILSGGTGTSKTRLRREKYSKGYVVLDAPEIFLSLCRGRYLDFPGPLEEPMELIGFGVARRIFRERRNIVTEIIGIKYEPVTELIDTIKAVNYDVDFIHVTCDINVAWEQNINRSRNNISAYYAEPYHFRWILAAIHP